VTAAIAAATLASDVTSSATTSTDPPAPRIRAVTSSVSSRRTSLATM
jgi:hypothetical protein